MYRQTGSCTSLGRLPHNRWHPRARLLTGTHTYKTGFEWRNDMQRNAGLNGKFGQFAFNAQQSGLPSTLGQNLSGGNPASHDGLGRSRRGGLLGTVSIRRGGVRPEQFKAIRSRQRQPSSSLEEKP